MGMTKKEFVAQLTAELQENPRAVLAGHGLPAVILKEISNRPDIIAKLVTVLFSTKLWKKGVKGLKKSPGFIIKGYKNFKELQTKSVMDIEEFEVSLSAEDQETFSTDTNCISIVCVPDQKAEEGSEETKIAFGKSIPLEYVKAVSKAYKIAGCYYVCIYFGDSIVRPSEEKVASAKEKVRKRKYNKRTKGKIVAEIKAKAKAKLEKIATENAGLSANLKMNSAGMQQFSQFGKSLGFDAADPKAAMAAFKTYDANNKKLVRSLSATDKGIYEMAVELVAEKKLDAAKILLKKINNPAITALVLGTVPATVDAAKAQRIKELRKIMRQISEKNQSLLTSMEAATDSKLRASIKFRIKQNKAKYDQLKAKIQMLTKGVVNLSTVKAKAKMIAEIQAKIESNTALGMSVQQSLNTALAKYSDIPVQQKQQIRQQIIQQVAQGMPADYVVEQVIQQQIFVGEEEITEPVLDLDNPYDNGSQLANTGSIADILRGL